jgi:hypothetical protein
MYNITDYDSVDSESPILQKIKYNGIELALINRNFIPTDELPLGYSKEVIDYLQVERNWKNSLLITGKTNINYTLNWDLFISENDYLILCNIYASYRNDYILGLEGSTNIYTPSPNQYLNIELVDNRIKDVFENTYKTYKIMITNISKVEEFFFREKMVKIKMEAVTL